MEKTWKDYLGEYFLPILMGVALVLGLAVSSCGRSDAKQADQIDEVSYTEHVCSGVTDTNWPGEWGQLPARQVCENIILTSDRVPCTLGDVAFSCGLLHDGSVDVHRGWLPAFTLSLSELARIGDNFVIIQPIDEKEAHDGRSR